MEQTDRTDLSSDPQLLLLAAFLRDGLEVDGQVIEVAAATWAIAGRISYDGEVILTEFDAPDRAQLVLAHLGQLTARGDEPR